MTERKPPAKKAATKKAPPAKKAAPRRPAPKRDDQVLQLRTKKGLSLEAIAKRLRFRDVAAAAAAYERALAKALPEPPDKTKREVLDRIRAAEDELWEQAEDGDLAAIAQLVNLDIERQIVSRDQLYLSGDRVGPVEAATQKEVSRLSEAAPALAAAALVLSKTVDDTLEPGPRATVAREHRMAMSQLRGLAGTNPAFGRPPTPTPEPVPTTKGKKRVVVPESELDALRRRAAERAAQGGAG